MSERTTVPPLVTKAMKLVLRSPVHGLVSKSILLFSFNGRKSGKTYTTPVSYSQSGDQLSIFTHAAWWKNLRRDETVTLRLRGREVRGLAEPVADDKKVIAARLAEHLQKVPSDAGFYGVTFDSHGNPNADELEKAVQSVVMISVRLC